MHRATHACCGGHASLVTASACCSIATPPATVPATTDTALAASSTAAPAEVATADHVASVAPLARSSESAVRARAARQHEVGLFTLLSTFLN
ncbi:MAG: hypothetical protein ACM3OB_02555 [Acidobacteriota bacterium]